MNEIVDKFNDEARTIEAQLEELGKMICDVPNSSESWSNVNMALACLRRAIHSSFHMYEEA